MPQVTKRSAAQTLGTSMLVHKISTTTAINLYCVFVVILTNCYDSNNRLK